MIAFDEAARFGKPQLSGSFEVHLFSIFIFRVGEETRSAICKRVPRTNRERSFLDF